MVAETKYAYGTRAWLKFEYLTPLPFSRSLTDPSLLLEDEVQWIDAFHSQCWATVAPLLTSGDLDDAADAARARQWPARGAPLQEEGVPAGASYDRCFEVPQHLDFLGARAVVVAVVVLSVIYALTERIIWDSRARGASVLIFL